MLRASGQTKWLCVLFCVLQGWFLLYFLFNIGSNPQTTAAVWPGLWEAERSSEEAFHVGRPCSTVEVVETSAEEDRDHDWDENNNDDGDEKGFQPDNYPYLLIHGTEHHSLLLWKIKYDDHFSSDNPPLHDQLTMTPTLKEAEAEEVGSVRDSGSKFFRLALRRGKAGPAEMKRW